MQAGKANIFECLRKERRAIEIDAKVERLTSLPGCLSRQKYLPERRKARREERL